MTSEIRVNSLTNRSGLSTVSITDTGAVIAGIISATSFSGPIVGDVTGNVTATTGSFSGDVSIGGTLTYEDVTNIDSVGIITAQAGIHIDDSIVHLGDTNTKIRFPAADTITAETAGLERLRITSDGNVLVGTTDATIYNNGDSDSEGIVLRNGEVIDIARKGDLQLTLNRQTNDGHHIGFFRSGSPKSYISTRNDAFCIDVNSSERLRIDSSGRVLIAQTSSLLSYAGLQIKGDADTGAHICLAHKTATPVSGNNIGSIRFTNNAGGIGVIIGVEADGNWSGSSQPSRIIFATATSGSTSVTERLRIASDGNVSIGGMAPNAFSNYNTLTIGGAGAVTGSGIDFERSDGNIYGRIFGDSNGLQIGAIQSGDYIRFEVGSGTERMRIHSNGKISVGTNSNVLYGDFQVNQSAGNDESGIGILANNQARSMRLYCDNSSNAIINSGDGGGAVLKLNEGAGQVRIGTGGLTFNGDTAAANALDDYEEGTWTPGLNIGGNNATHSIQEGSYVKIGRLVVCYGMITITNKGSGTGGTIMTGLPFQVVNILPTTSLEGGGLFTYQSGMNGIYGPMTIMPAQGGTTASIYGAISSNGSMTGVSNTNLTNTLDSRFTFSYQTDS